MSTGSGAFDGCAPRTNEATSLAGLIGPERTAALLGDPATAEGLPGAAYVASEVYALEQRTVFDAGWFAVGFASDVPEPGDVWPVTVAGWEFVLVRGGDGAIRAFHNVCRHRGMKVVREPGTVTSLRCGWHCWTYALDGTLVGTPLIGGRGVNHAEGFKRNELGLLPVACATWHDLVFVRPAPDGVPFEQHIAPLAAFFAEYDLDAVGMGAKGDEVVLPANWKVVVEGGIEGYHLPWVHPQMEQPPGYDVELGGDTYVGICSDLARYGAPPPADEMRLPLFPHLRDSAARGEAQRFNILFVVPTAIVSVYPEHCVLTLLRPIDVQRTGVRRRFYFYGDAATDPACAHLRADTLTGWYAVSAQDVDYADEVQRLSAVRARLGLSTRFAPHWEQGVLEFQRWVLRAADEQRDPAAVPPVRTLRPGREVAAAG